MLLSDYSRIVNLPGVSISVADMLAALARVAGPQMLERIRWERDPAVECIVGGWPAAWDVSRAHALGFGGDADFDSIIRAYIEDDLPAVAASLI